LGSSADKFGHVIARSILHGLRAPLRSARPPGLIIIYNVYAIVELFVLVDIVDLTKNFIEIFIKK
jgi:hypothetical protein